MFGSTILEKSCPPDDASGRERVHGRERDSPDRADVQLRRSRAPDLRFDWSIPGRFAAERARVGGAQLAAEEDLPHPGARLDDRRQAPGAAGGRENEQVRTVRQRFPGGRGG